MCSAITRGDSKFCALHDGSIQSWQDVAQNAKLTRVAGYCSWCFERGEHCLEKRSRVPLQRNTYACVQCGHATIPCRLCSNMARQTPAWSDERCFECDGTIASFDDTPRADIEKAVTVSDRICPWCLAPGARHLLIQSGKIQRSVYACCECGNRTLKCVRCDVAMAMGGVVADAKFCTLCGVLHRSTADEWSERRAVKDQLTAQLNNTERIVDEMRRESEARDACGDALRRPFMLLVSMAPAQRNRIANALGFSMFTDECFGSPHLEAKRILECALQSAKHASEKVTFRQADRSWLHLLYRVLQVFACAERIKKAQSIVEEFDAAAADAAATTNSNELLQRMENEFFYEIAAMNAKSLSDERQEALIRESKEFSKVVDDMEKKGGISMHRDVVALETSLLKEVGKRSLDVNISTLTVATQLLNYVPTVMPSVAGTSTAAIVAPISAQLALLSTPLFFLGIFGVVSTIGKLALSSRESMLVLPFTQIIHQRLVLASAGVRFEDYCGE